MAIYPITKKEHDQIKHDQAWGIHNFLLFTRKGKRYKCSTTGAAGLKEIARFNTAQSQVEKDQRALDLITGQKRVD